MKMLLKIVGTLALGLSAAGLVFPSYAKTLLGMASEGIQSQVPIDFEIQRASGLVAAIDPQIETCKREVAEAEVERENLGREVATLTEAVAGDERRLRQDRAAVAAIGPVAAVETAVSAVFAGGGVGAGDRVARDLQQKLERVKAAGTLLTGKRALLERQTRNVAAAREKLDAVRTEKLRLQDLIGSLRVQKHQVDALAARSPGMQLDDTALAQARTLLDGIKNRLDVAQKMLENDLAFAPETASPRVALGPVLSDVGEYFATAVERR